MITAATIYLSIGLALLACILRSVFAVHDDWIAQGKDKWVTRFSMISASIGTILLWPGMLMIIFTAIYLEFSDDRA